MRYHFLLAQETIGRAYEEYSRLTVPPAVLINN